MTVFKTYFKILKKNIGIIILYSSILLIFTTIGTTSEDTTTTFKAEKPDVAIINYDTNSKVVKNLETYIKKNANIVNIKNEENALKDALFYRDVNAIIYIYEGYTTDYLNNQEKEIKIELTNDYNASYFKMLVDRYFKIADISNNHYKSEEEIISSINKSLSKSKTIEIKNSLDTGSLDNLAYYFNFANYSILALSIYIIAMMMSTFNEEKIKKRNMISSMKISTFTKELYLANLLFIFFVWIFIVFLGFIIHKEILLTENGLFMILNSFIFTFCASSIGFLIGSIIKNKEAISGIVNVISLGSSFLCGCFVPNEYLPEYVVNCSKILPSYWYIHNNNLIKSIENFSFHSLSNVIVGWITILAFAIFFFLITLSYNKKKK